MLESIGEKLRLARENRKLTYKDVMKETNISMTFLEALEDEEFEKFPSETYLIGFLKSYAEFLRLDTEEMIQAYKGFKIGESATPLEELTKPTKPSIPLIVSSLLNKYRNIVFVGGVSILILLVILGIRALVKSSVSVSGDDSMDSLRKNYHEKHKKSEIDNIKNLQLANNSGIILVYANEAVQFLVDNKEVVFLVKEIKENTVILEILPGNSIEKFEMEKQRTISIEGCPRQVSFTLKGLTENRAKIMVNLAEKAEPLKEEVAKEEPFKAIDTTSVIAQDKSNLKIVFEAEFAEKSFVELYLDGVRKIRGFIPKGNRERWEAAEYIQIKIGNAGGIKSKINGKDYVFGQSGQVSNKVITWKKDVNNPNLYHIVINDW